MKSGRGVLEYISVRNQAIIHCQLTVLHSLISRSLSRHSAGIGERWITGRCAL